MSTGCIILLALGGLAVLGFIWMVVQPRRFRYMMHIIKQLPSIPFRYLT